MDNVLRVIQNEKNAAYFEVIVFSTSLKEHLEKLECVFRGWGNLILKFNLTNRNLSEKSSVFEHTVTSHGVKLFPDKIYIEFPYSKNGKGTPRLSRLIKDFSELTKTKTNYLKEDPNLKIVEIFCQLSEVVKILSRTEHYFQYLDFNKPFGWTTDVSRVALGSCCHKVLLEET